MKTIEHVRGTAIPVRGNDIDTDRIFPGRFLKLLSFADAGRYAFAEEREQFTAAGKVHPLDDPRFRDATVMLVDSNFGCGSSREHAVQALMRWNRGIAAFIGESFSEIFAGNCAANGIPAVTVDRDVIDTLAAAVEGDPNLKIEVDVEGRRIRLGPDHYDFSLADGIRRELLSGAWDSTAVLLEVREQVLALSSSLPCPRTSPRPTAPCGTGQ